MSRALLISDVNLVSNQGASDALMNARVLLVEEHSLLAVGLELALSERNWDVQTTSGPTVADVVAQSNTFLHKTVHEHNKKEKSHEQKMDWGMFTDFDSDDNSCKYFFGKTE